MIELVGLSLATTSHCCDAPHTSNSYIITKKIISNFMVEIQLYLMIFKITSVYKLIKRSDIIHIFWSLFFTLNSRGAASHNELFKKLFPSVHSNTQKHSVLAFC